MDHAQQVVVSGLRAHREVKIWAIPARGRAFGPNGERVHAVSPSVDNVRLSENPLRRQSERQSDSVNNLGGVAVLTVAI